MADATVGANFPCPTSLALAGSDRVLCVFEHLGGNPTVPFSWKGAQMPDKVSITVTLIDASQHVQENGGVDPAFAETIYNYTMAMATIEIRHIAFVLAINHNPWNNTARTLSLPNFPCNVVPVTCLSDHSVMGEGGQLLETLIKASKMRLPPPLEDKIRDTFFAKMPAGQEWTPSLITDLQLYLNDLDEQEEKKGGFIPIADE